ncbi:hypothetical protein Tco_0523930 [Tanacetum coccineum]
MALPNEHQLTFDQYVDAQSMFAAIKARFGGNEATKKTQKALLKQQYENFSASSSESLDSILSASRLVSTIGNSGCVMPSVQSPKGSQLVHEDLSKLMYDLEDGFKVRSLSTAIKWEILPEECSSTRSKHTTMVLDLIGVTWQRKKFRQTWHSQTLSDTDFKAASYKRGLATLEGLEEFKEPEGGSANNRGNRIPVNTVQGSVKLVDLLVASIWLMLPMSKLVNAAGEKVNAAESLLVVSTEVNAN